MADIIILMLTAASALYVIAVAGTSIVDAVWRVRARRVAQDELFAERLAGRALPDVRREFPPFPFPIRASRFQFWLASLLWRGRLRPPDPLGLVTVEDYVVDAAIREEIDEVVSQKPVHRGPGRLTSRSS